MFRIIAKVFENKNYQGQYRYIHDNVTDFNTELGFDNKVSSIIVYQGPEYQKNDKFIFWEHPSFLGGQIDLEPGMYPDIHVQPYNWGDKISSAQLQIVQSPPVAANVRLEVRIYENADCGGQYRGILYAEPDLSNQGFNDKITSIQILPGPAYERGWKAAFYRDKNMSGPVLQPGWFDPGTIINNLKKSPYNFNDQISSIDIKKI